MMTCLRRGDAMIRAVIGGILDFRGLRAELDQTESIPSRQMDRRLVDALGDNGRRPVAVSGALHDSAVLAPHIHTVMLFVPSKDGISHNPAEFSRVEDIAAAAQVVERLFGFCMPGNFSGLKKTRRQKGSSVSPRRRCVLGGESAARSGIAAEATGAPVARTVALQGAVEESARLEDQRDDARGVGVRAREERPEDVPHRAGQRRGLGRGGRRRGGAAGAGSRRAEARVKGSAARSPIMLPAYGRMRGERGVSAGERRRAAPRRGA